MRIHKEGKGILTKLLLAIIMVDVAVACFFYQRSEFGGIDLWFQLAGLPLLFEFLPQSQSNVRRE